jgi:hypothetical protein
MDNVTHAQLSGNVVVPSATPAERTARAAPASHGPEGRGRGGAAHPPTANAPAAAGEEPPKRVVIRAQRLGLGSDFPLSPRRSVAIRSFSAAFLDADVNGDAGARTWLAQRAAQWLAGTANLSVKN